MKLVTQNKKYTNPREGHKTPMYVSNTKNLVTARAQSRARLSCYKRACREMLLFHAGILGQAFVSYFFTRLKSLNILLIQALLAHTMSKLLRCMGLLTKIRDIKNGLDIPNLITETLPTSRKDWIKPAHTSSSRKIISLFPWLCTVCTNILWLAANDQK